MQQVETIHTTKKRCMRKFVAVDVSLFVNEQSGVFEVISQVLRDYKSNTGLAMVVQTSIRSDDDERTVALSANLKKQ